ncbi:MAG TPA: hypothetical protein VFV31_00150 [Chitinophagaceae bacterium]|nr:hypothetical protein [Chitinophagaceae bacterium]
MTTASENKQEKTNRNLQRIGYLALTITGIIMMLIDKSPAAGISNLGVALVFDPFDPQLAFNKRPLWQRLWLITHVVVLLGLFGWMLLA